MKRWNIEKSEHCECVIIDGFINEIERVCKKHNLSISHEDGYGAFMIGKFREADIKSLASAHCLFSEEECDKWADNF